MVIEKENFFQRNGLQLAVQVIGVGVLLLNLWLATKLAPLAQNLELLTQRVSAQEIITANFSQDHTDIQVVKAKVDEIKSDVVEIKGDIKFIRNRTE